MEDFKTYTLEELSIGKGTYGIAASAVPYDSQKPTYLRITDINDDGTINQAGLMSVDAPNASEFLLKANDLVFARTGNSTGRTYFYEGTESPLVYAGFLIKFSIDEKKVNPRILKYYTHSQTYYNWIKSFDTGGTRGNINAKTYGSMPVCLPVSRKTQDKIVELLSSFDRKIELNRRINDNLEQQAQALFKAWFVEFEPFGGTMPSNWEICEAQKYFNINIGKTPPRNEMRWFSQKSTDCKWASISDLGKCGLFINDTSEYLTKDAVETFNIIVVPKGTILLSFKLTLGRVSITTCPLTTNEAIARFLINHDYEREYLYLLLKQFDYTSLGNTSSIATAVNSKIIRSMPIMMPTVDVLQRFHHIVSPIFTRMRFLSDEIMQLTDTRNTVLPQLMSGGLKINNLNC